MAKKKRVKGDGPDVLTIRVATAGIGRQGFKAWIEGLDDIDRQDGDDTGTYDTPREAVDARMEELERHVVLRGWIAYVEPE